MLPQALHVLRQDAHVCIFCVWVTANLGGAELLDLVQEGIDLRAHYDELLVPARDLSVGRSLGI